MNIFYWIIDNYMNINIS